MQAPWEDVAFSRGLHAMPATYLRHLKGYLLRGTAATWASVLLLGTPRTVPLENLQPKPVGLSLLETDAQTWGGRVFSQSWSSRHYKQH